MKKTYKEVLKIFSYSLSVTDCANMMKTLNPDINKSDVIEFLHQQSHQELNFAFVELNSAFDKHEAKQRLHYFKNLLEDD